MIMRQERKLHFVLTSIRKTSVKSMRNGQTAAIGSPKASSYLARGGKEDSGGAGDGVPWWSGYLVDRAPFPYSTERPWNASICPMY